VAYSRQINRFATALAIEAVAKHEIFVDEKKRSPERAFILLSGVARIICRNRKGDCTALIMVARGIIPGFPPPLALWLVVGIAGGAR